MSVCMFVCMCVILCSWASLSVGFACSYDCECDLALCVCP